MKTNHLNLITFVITTSLAFLIYLATLAPDLTWANHSADGGDLITAAVTLGVPHPSGYPTYVLLGKIFSFFSIGSLAYRFNIFSAVTVSLAAGFVTASGFYLLRHNFPEKRKGKGLYFRKGSGITAVAAGLTFAFAPLIWGQAVVSEVYGLNLLCLALFLWALVSERPSWLAGLLLGLSITTHLTSLLMLPMAILLIGKQQIRNFMFGFVMGLIPFLLLPFLAQSGSPTIWGQANTLGGWWWLVSGQLYQANLFNLAAIEVPARLQEWGFILPAQFLWLGFLLLFVGLVAAGRTAVTPQFSRLSLFMSGTALLYLLYAFGYSTSDAIVFTTPALLLWAILLAPAMKDLGWLALGLPLFLLLLNFQAQDLSKQAQLRPLAEELLAQSPANALVLTADASTTFTLWYYHHAEGQRTDLAIVDTNLFQFDWYRNQLRERTNLFIPEGDDLAAFYKANELERPLCHAIIQPDEQPPVINSCLEK